MSTARLAIYIKNFLNNLIQSVKSLILGRFYPNGKCNETRLPSQE